MWKEILNGLMRRYQERVPDVKRLIQVMIAEGIINKRADIENDHIAFRTMGVKNLGVQSLEKIFLHYGYRKRDFYHFKEKKIDAWWFSPPDNHNPRIFVSELRVGDLSDKVQKIIRQYTDTVTSDPVEQIDLDDSRAVDQYLHSGLWPLPTLSDYQTLLAESEYAAWVIFNRYYLNHFTISVHNLPEGYDTVREFNKFLKQHRFKLNSSGGEIKISRDGKLIQSATVAKNIEATFAEDKRKEIAGSYVEFAERKVLEQYKNLPKDKIKRKHRRNGFEVGNADKIFESTDTDQVKGGNE